METKTDLVEDVLEAAEEGENGSRGRDERGANTGTHTNERTGELSSSAESRRGSYLHPHVTHAISHLHGKTFQQLVYEDRRRFTVTPYRGSSAVSITFTSVPVAMTS